MCFFLCIVTLPDQIFLLLGRKISPSELVLANPGKGFVAVVKLLFMGAEPDARMRLRDAVAVVTVYNRIVPDDAEERREKAEHLRVIPEKKPKADKESARSGTKRQQEVYATIDKSYEDMKDSKRVTEDSALVSLRYTAANSRASSASVIP